MNANYSTDRPINKVDEDLLGRASFSQRLGKAIVEYKGEESLVIGLYGGWGTGKTSVVNMMIDSIDSVSMDDNKPLVVRFSPWNYTDNINLINQFFSCLKIKVGNDKSGKMKEIGDALNDYSGVFELITFVPGISKIAPALIIAFKMGAKMLGKSPDLDGARKKLEEKLIKAGRKIVVVIDDIDRLTNTQIRDIFQLVKQVGDLPNLIYVLVMDRGVVTRALKEVHNYDGDEYLEKIIQIPFEIPVLDKGKLQNIFLGKLNSVASEIGGNIIYDQQYWNKIYENCVYPYICTLRDINRVINVFQFKYALLYQECSFEDMIGLSTLEVMEPKLYKWISNNKESVCGGVLHGLLLDREKAKNYRKYYTDEFVNMGINPERALKSVAAMFPVFAKDINEDFIYAYDNLHNESANIRGQMRVAQEEHYDIYFSLDLKSVSVPRGIINSCINELDEKQLIEVINKINEDGKIAYFLNEMRSLCNNVPYERINMIASILFDLRSSFIGGVPKAIFPISSSFLAEYCVFDLLKRLKTNEERYLFYKNAVERAGKESLGALSNDINRLELAYGRLAGDIEKKENQLISLAQLKELEKDYVNKIQELAYKEGIIGIEDYGLSFYLWECLDKESARKYIKNLFKDVVSTLKFICSLAGHWSGTSGSGWSFNDDNYKDYITDDEVYDTIMQNVQEKIECFTDLELVKLASFVLNYKKDQRIDYATEQRAMQLVKKWKNED